MSEDDVLFGYRLQLFDHAARVGVSEACRTFGVHRSTYYRWKRQVDRFGLEVLRPRERRRPKMPNQLSALVEQRIVAFALGQPGLGPRRIAAELARPKWGGIVVSPNGVWRCPRRHGLNTRAKRLALVAGYRAPYEPPRPAVPQRHVEASRPGELVGVDSFYVGRLHGTRGTVWQLTAIDVCSSYAWAELVSCPSGQPQPAQSSRLVCRVARELRAAGWLLERVLTDNGMEYRAERFRRGIAVHGVAISRIRPGRPQSNGAVESLHRTLLEECWRPAFARFVHLRFQGPAPRARRLPALLQLRPSAHRASHSRPHPRRHRLRCSQDGAEMSRTCRHILESVQARRRRYPKGSPPAERAAGQPQSRRSRRREARGTAGPLCFGRYACGYLGTVS
jgi:transposase InsO family protein